MGPSPEAGVFGTMGNQEEPSAAEPGELWSWLPRLSLRQLRVEERLRSWAAQEHLRPWLDWLTGEINQAVDVAKPEILWRASGLRRPGLIAQFRWPVLDARAALGLEVPLAHAVVDRLLGYDRPFAESRLQLTPVEWGVWSYLVVRALDATSGGSPPVRRDDEKPLGAPERFGLVLDRVGPDPFDPVDLGAIVTLRWSVRVGSTTGTARFWLPESALNLWLATDPPRSRELPIQLPSKVGELTSLWRAEAGFVVLSQGLRRLRKGGVQPLRDSKLAGTPQSPTGPITLVCDLAGSGCRQLLPAEPVAASGGRLVRLTGPRQSQVRPRPALTLGTSEIMSEYASRPADGPGASVPSPEALPLDVPVTLSVEIGRVNLTLNRLADLKPGDVIELARHSREPVELVSAGRVVARGELVLIDTELGVRITQVFL
jgi:flagellar motor switch protein FliN/FliY